MDGIKIWYRSKFCREITFGIPIYFCITIIILIKHAQTDLDEVLKISRLSPGIIKTAERQIM